MRKTTNEILVDHGDWLEIDISTPKHPDSVMKIDKKSWLFLQELGIGRVSSAVTSPLSCNIYAQCGLGNKKTHIHRLLLPDAKIRDHFDRNGLNNRMSNLVVSTSSRNCVNCRVSKNNQSGVTGVGLHTDKIRWRSRIHVNGKEHHLGLFYKFEDAVLARKNAEEKYYENCIS